MNSHRPLGFPRRVRTEVEVKICSESGSVGDDCFDVALAFVLHTMQRVYLPQYFRSSNFMEQLNDRKAAMISISCPPSAPASNQNHAQSGRNKRSPSHSSSAASTGAFGQLTNGAGLQSGRVTRDSPKALSESARSTNSLRTAQPMLSNSTLAARKQRWVYLNNALIHQSCHAYFRTGRQIGDSR